MTQKAIKFNIIVVFITAVMLLSYVLFSTQIHYAVRKYLFHDDNAAYNVSLKNGDAGLIDSTTDKSSIMFVYQEYTISGDRYISVCEAIYNDGTMKGFSTSGKTTDKGYIDITDASNLFYLVSSKKDDTYNIKQLSYEDIDTLRTAYLKSLDSSLDMQYSTTGLSEEDEAGDHCQIMWGVQYKQGKPSLLKYYSYSDGVIAVLSDDKGENMYETLRNYWT